MILPDGLIFAAAFLLAEEKKRAARSHTSAIRLKELAAEGLELAWQMALLVLLCLAARQADARLAEAFHFEKAACLCGAYLLAVIRAKSPVYFCVLAALALGLSGTASGHWQVLLEGAGLAVFAVISLQALYLGIKERLLFVRVPAPAAGLPLALLGFFLVLFSVWAAGFFCLS